MIEILKKILRRVQSGFFYGLNKLNFKLKDVEIDDSFQISGTIAIRNNGHITIGKNFKANSGKRYNPIGGDTILRLICQKNGVISIGNNCGISNSTFSAKDKIFIGDYVMIGGGCKFWDNDFHSLNPEIRVSEFDNDIKSAPIIINDYAFIGGGSTILKGVEIGEKSVIAAGSVVTKSVPENEIWGGNPARFLKKIDYFN